MDALLQQLRTKAKDVQDLLIHIDMHTTGKDMMHVRAMRNEAINLVTGIQTYIDGKHNEREKDEQTCTGTGAAKKRPQDRGDGSGAASTAAKHREGASGQGAKTSRGAGGQGGCAKGGGVMHYTVRDITRRGKETTIEDRARISVDRGGMFLVMDGEGERIIMQAERARVESIFVSGLLVSGMVGTGVTKTGLRKYEYREIYCAYLKGGE